MRKLLLGLCFALLGFQSCSDVLDLDPSSSYSENTAYASIKNVDLYVKDFYRIFYQNADIASADFIMDDGCTDLIKYTWSVFAPGANVNKFFYNNNLISPDANFRDRWGVSYLQIRELNEFLVDVNNGLANKLDKDEMAIRIAEVRFMRAFAYQELVVRYGGVILRVAEDDVDDHNQRAKARSTEAECWDFIIGEYNKATAALPEKWQDENGVNNVGRLTKGAAYGMMARASLYAGRWQGAIDASDEVMKLEGKGIYRLLDKNQYDDVFTKVNNNELIIPVNYVSMVLQHSFNYFFCPPYDYKNAGSQKDDCGAAGTPTEEYASQFDIKVNGNWQPFSWNNLSSYSDGPWANRDPRFYSSILYNEASWIKNRKLEVFEGGHDGFFQYANDPSHEYKRGTTTGYYIRKFVKKDEKINFVDIQSDQFWIEMRLAEIYLIRSEAHARLNQWPLAYTYLNRIRTRVGLEDLAQQGSWDRYLLDLEKERICELGMEGHRYFDLVRWGKAVERLDNMKVHGVKIIQIPSGGFDYEIVEADTENRNFSKKHTIFPIPTSELAANTLCEQSELWK